MQLRKLKMVNHANKLTKGAIAVLQEVLRPTKLKLEQTLPFLEEIVPIYPRNHKS